MEESSSQCRMRMPLHSSYTAGFLQDVPSVTRIALLLALAAAPGLAQDKIVPIDQEPKHVLRFQNRHVRFFDVQLPPGYQALWHTHLHDGVFVNIGAAPTLAQELGGQPQPRPPVAQGRGKWPRADRSGHLYRL